MTNETLKEAVSKFTSDIKETKYSSTERADFLTNIYFDVDPKTNNTTRIIIHYFAHRYFYKRDVLHQEAWQACEIWREAYRSS